MSPEERLRAGRAVEAKVELSGLTVAEVAAAVRIHERTLKELMSGRRWPRDSIRHGIERVLGWDAGEIFRQAQGGLQVLAGFTDAELAAELHYRLCSQERSFSRHARR